MSFLCDKEYIMPKEWPGVHQEVVEILSEMVCDCCTYNEQLDSMGITSYAEALRYLAVCGKIKIISEHGRRVMGRWVEKND